VPTAGLEYHCVLLALSVFNLSFVLISGVPQSRYVGLNTCITVLIFHHAILVGYTLCSKEQSPVVFASKYKKSGPISTIFTAQRVCIARTMPWQHVCSSVCRSHTGILSKI